MNKTLFAVLAVSLLSVGACGNDSRSEHRRIPVSVSVVQPSVISEILEAPCRLRSEHYAIISTSVPSVVEEVLVSQGDTVLSGERLLRLRSDDMQQAAVSDAAALVSVAEVYSEYAEANLLRASNLLERGALSEAEFDNLSAEAETAKASFKQVEAGYRAALSSAADGYVEAPFPGVVGRIEATRGNPASGILLGISGYGLLQADLLVSPRHLSKLKVGLPAVFTTDHFPGQMFSGSVVSVAESADPLSGLVPLTAQFADTTGRLVAGLSGTVAISLDTKEDALVLRGSSMHYLGGNRWRVAVVENGVAEMRTVCTGIRKGTLYEITQGLSLGDSVVGMGHTLLSEGVPVEVVK